MAKLEDINFLHAGIDTEKVNAKRLGLKPGGPEKAGLVEVENKGYGVKFEAPDGSFKFYTTKEGAELVAKMKARRGHTGASGGQPPLAVARGETVVERKERLAKAAKAAKDKKPQT